MTTLIQNYPLKPLNTFGIDANADYYTELYSINDIKDCLMDPRVKSLPKLVIGGGSNLLFGGDFHGIVLHPKLKGIEITDENKEYAIVKAFAGEVWDDFVSYAVSANLGGIENLSLIPGNVGASPIQNIGAYGVEAKDVIESVEGINLSSLEEFKIMAKDCHFGYRDSLFKHELKNKTIVTAVNFKLQKQHTLVTHYGNIEEELKKYPVRNISTVRLAVMAIRERKLPDPKVAGNAGSFFKNPLINAEKANELKRLYPTLSVYPTNTSEAKIPAAWLIEQCGWKGKSIGNVGSHPHQPLVLVNHGNASGNEIIAFAKNIQASVIEKFGIELEMEVNIIQQHA
jgi:UDP-N-acetylmuramate dehydrogenase